MKKLLKYIQTQRKKTAQNIEEYNNRMKRYCDLKHELKWMYLVTLKPYIYLYFNSPLMIIFTD